MTTDIPQQVLSDELREAIGARCVKVAVFLTFRFDPGFFEEEILPILFDQSFSHVPKLRLLQLKEALMVRNAGEFVVYYDRGALTAGARPAKLDYRRIGLARSTGCFHPKSILLLLENHYGETVRDSLLVVTLSANLTRSGWWENVEVAHLEEIREGDKCSLRRDLLDLISRVKREDKTGNQHRALESIREFLLYRVSEVKHRTQRGGWRPRLYTGRETVPDFLWNFVEPGEYNLEVISPYFDDTDSANTLRTLCDTLEPKGARVFLPQGKDGAALCREGFFEAVERLPGVKWGKLPSEVLRLASADKNVQAGRFVHAKVYRFWNREREIYFIGSVNLTGAAHSRGRAGNFETGILVEPGRRASTSRPGWWLAPMGKEKPAEFREEAFEGVATDDKGIGALSLRFTWRRDALEYFWEQPYGSVPRKAAIGAQGVPKFCIEPILFGAWTSLPAEAAGEIKELLKSTSFIEVSVDDGEPFRVLVREENMAYKPSMLLSLSAEEILHYWSLLSPEQREAFISSREPTLADGTELATIKAQVVKIDTMFDRFAGIFHAFGRLNQHVCDALEADRETEAIYRLFGKKYDSLPSLIEKVVADEDGDRVNRYVTLLCTKQFVKKVEDDEAVFAQRHRDEFRSVKRQLEVINRIRGGFTFDTPEEQEEFFDWFEQMFFLEIPVPSEEAA